MNDSGINNSPPDEAIAAELIRNCPMFEISPDPSALLGADGCLIGVNAAFEAVLGYRNDELFETPYRLLVHEEDLPIVDAGMEALRQGARVSEAELRLLARNGEEYWFQWRVAPLAEGQFLAVGRDISETRRRDERMRAMLGALPDALLVLDGQCRVVWSNVNAAALFDTEAGRLMGLSLDALTLPQIDPLEAQQRAQRTECWVVRPDGHLAPVTLTVRPIEEGVQWRWLVTLQDMQRCLKAEETLSLTGEALAQMDTGYWIRDRASDTLYWSPQLCRILGYEPVARETVHAEFIARIHPEDRAAMEALVAEAMGPGARDNYSLEFRLLRDSGESRIVRSIIRIRRDASGHPWQIVGTVQDVTESLAAERRQRQEQELASAIFDTSDALLMVLDSDGRVMRLNRAAEQLTGYSERELLGRQVLPLLLPEEEHRAVATVLAHLKTNGLPSTHLNHCLTRDGERRLITWQNNVVRDEQGEIARIVATGIDITDEQRSRQLLSESEERYRRLLELSFDLVALQSDGRIVYINPAGAQMLGADAPQELIGVEARRFVPEEYFPIFKARMATILERGGVAPLFEYKHRTLDGELLDVEAVSIPVHYQGRMAVLSVIRNITERKNAERALQEQERFFQTLARVAPVGIYRTASDGQVVYVNDRCLEIIGLTAEDVLGEFWRKRVHPADQRRVFVAWDAAVSAGRDFAMEYRILGADGQVRWVLSQATLERDETGEVVGFVGTVADISRLKRDEAELQAYHVELERRVEERTHRLSLVNRELEAFSYSVSHDLRAPLRAIAGFCQVLFEDCHAQLDEQARYCLERIGTNTEYMRQLIDELLALAQVSRHELIREPIDLASICREILEEYRRAEPERRVETVIDDSLSVEADPRLVRILLRNLLDNAWKYTSRKAVSHIRIVMCEDGASICVEDNGAGFDSDAADGLFRAFQRLHPADEFEGTGIGLATVQRIVHRHGGHIWAEAEPGAGARFYFHLG